MKRIAVVLALLVVGLVAWVLIDSDGMSTTIASWLDQLIEWIDRLAPDLSSITGSATPLTRNRDTPAPTPARVL